MRPDPEAMAHAIRRELDSAFRTAGNLQARLSDMRHATPLVDATARALQSLDALADDIIEQARRADFADEKAKLRFMARGVWLAIDKLSANVSVADGAHAAESGPTGPLPRGTTSDGVVPSRSACAHPILRGAGPQYCEECGAEVPFKASADPYVEVNGGELEPIEDVYRPEGVLIVQTELRKARELRALAMELFAELAAADAVMDGECEHVTDLLNRAQDILRPGTREAE